MKLNKTQQSPWSTQKDTIPKKLNLFNKAKHIYSSIDYTNTI